MRTGKSSPPDESAPPPRSRRYDARVDRVQLLRDIWDARSVGDLEPLQGALAPDAKWRAVEDGPWNCESAAAIIDVFTRQLADGLSGRIEDAFEIGDRVVVGFRPDRPGPGAWPLDNGIRYLVVSLAGDRVTELRGCADRAAALAYAEGA
jgi:hypothetical protein